MPRTLSFRTRLTIAWTATVGALLALALSAIYLGASVYARRALDEQVRTVAATELASSTDGEQGIHIHDFPVTALGSADFAGKFVQQYDPAGSIIAQSPELADTPFRLDRSVLDQARAGLAPLVDVTIGSRPGRLVALSTDWQNERFVVAVGLYSDLLSANMARLQSLFAIVWLTSVSLTAALGYVLASRALAPVDRIMQRAALVARGHFEARLDPPTVNDEIGRMTTVLNEMLERLHGSLEANRRFAADASHELRSPLTAMAGEIDVALMRERTPAEYRETLHLVRERLDELASLADSLMLLVRAEERHDEIVVKEVPLLALIRGAVQRVRPLARSREITVTVDDLPEMVVYGDARLLTRVFDNVLSNAVQYNRDSGRVTVRGHVEEASPEAWETASVVVHVSDTGPGIPEDQWTRIFDRFFRLDHSRSRRTGGTGLGLALCRTILGLSRGSIAVVASSPAGTTFEIRLPGQRQPSAARPVAGAEMT